MAFVEGGVVEIFSEARKCKKIYQNKVDVYKSPTKKGDGMEKGKQHMRIEAY